MHLTVSIWALLVEASVTAGLPVAFRSMGKAYFTPKLFSFLRDLAKNNKREWFEANKGRYERDLKEPALEFISDFEPRLMKISTQFRADARPVGGSLFRIHQDRRFQKDRPPYKTHCGIQFRHAAGKDAHAPGFYLHLEPKESFVGLGLWRPETAVARDIRESIAERGPQWKKAAHGKRFREQFDLAGDSLKRPPRGVDPEHPLVDDLRRKDFIAVAPLSRSTVTDQEFMKTFVDLCRRGGPFMEFLCGATGVGY